MTFAARGLELSYGRLPALRGIDAELPANAITVLLGPNAAGKSTLLKCLIGALRPSGGAVLLDGDPVHRIPPRRLAERIAYVPQRSTVAAAFTVREVIELGRYALPPAQWRVDGAIEIMELQDIADRPYPHLSVGQQQRVTLARVLAQYESGGYLFLDEPVSAMDLAHIRLTARMLDGMVEHGATVLVALHDLTLASALADHAWVLDGGRLVAEGPAEEVLVPGRLEPIFGVPFRRIDDGEGGPLLIPEPPRVE